MCHHVSSNARKQNLIKNSLNKQKYRGKTDPLEIECHRHMTFIFANSLTHPVGNQVRHLYGTAMVICTEPVRQMFPKDACEH